MRKLRLVWEVKVNQWDNIMLWAATCTCFFGFQRAGEVHECASEVSYNTGADLNFADAAIDDLSNSSILRLKVSKTDSFRRGVDIS